MIVLSPAIIISIAIVTAIVLHAALFLLFKKAGFAGWNAFVPVLNIFTIFKITGRKWYWLILMLLPVIGFLFVMIAFFDLLHSFGRRRFYHFLLGLFFGPYYLFIVALNKKVEYTGPRLKYATPAPVFREWAEAVILAVVLVTAYIKPFWFETYNIPSQSMEGTLLMGDYILVSKVKYGPRLPITPIAIPFMQNANGQNNSYLDNFRLPYFRLPGFAYVKRGDVVVFNFPADDSKPVDRKTNYIKRCIALPGDTLFIDNKVVKVNGYIKAAPPLAQYNYMAEMNGNVNPEYFNGLGFGDATPVTNLSFYQFSINTLMADSLSKLKDVDTVRMVCYAPNRRILEVFPQSPAYPWNLDNFGPLYIPKKGQTVVLNEQNIKLYERIIKVYEQNDLRVNGPYIKINGGNVSSYTFKQNYYFMMGDNRDNSSDSRFWGFVPEDHIVGKAWFIWLSIDAEHNIRYNRLFQTIE